MNFNIIIIIIVPEIQYNVFEGPVLTYNYTDSFLWLYE